MIFPLEIDLTETQKQLDKTALDLVESQKENLVGRKKLAEQTRGTRQAVYTDLLSALPDIPHLISPALFFFLYRVQETP